MGKNVQLITTVNFSRGEWTIDLAKFSSEYVRRRDILGSDYAA